MNSLARALAPIAPTRSLRITIGALIAVLALGLAILALHLLALGDSGAEPHFAFDHLLYGSLMVAAPALCLARVALVPDQRGAWLLIGLGLAAWTAGEIYWLAALSGLDEPPYPSPADAGYLAAYPLFIGGVLMLLRARMRRLRASPLLDALLGALAITAIGTILLLGPIVDAVGGWTIAEQAVTLAYPVGDIFTVAFVAALLVLAGMHPGAAVGMVMVGLAITAAADALFSYQDAVDTYVEGTPLDLLWPLSGALIALGAWQRPADPQTPHVRGCRALALPSAFVLVALAVVGWYGVDEQGGIVERTIMGVILAALLARTIVGLTDNQRLLRRVQTDPLTGLGNRGKLFVDLEDALAEGTAQPRVLAYFDLDGFKLYNDTYGHPAGDSLLARLGDRLREALPDDAEGYRVGGDEFCVLADGRIDDSVATVTAAGAALRERGRGFVVTSSFGVAEFPREAATAEALLQLADQRLYAQKDSRGSSAGRQAEAVLVRTLHEHKPELARHGNGVARLASRTARRLGLDPGEFLALTRAAELHDVGKVAIPDAILSRRGPLSAEEWAFVRQHTIIGERILLAAPALAHVAAIVRSTHERFDGGGYPDGLAGEEIPIAARIIFACDAYDAMTSERAYASALSPEEARDELRRGAGTQFDPRVVDALCTVLDEDRERPSVWRGRTAPSVRARGRQRLGSDPSA